MAAENIHDVRAPKFVETSMSTYGREVLEDRAIPVDLDGFKPSQRRTLFALYELGSKPRGNYLKSARVVGDAMGKYHPHGDASLYDTLVNMVWARYPMIEGHGNFGNATGDPAAASRYTECRISQFGADTMEDLPVMPRTPNYSNETTEPVVTPARVPLLLANGSQGIAVGVACNIPPHNLNELIKATIRLIKKPNTKVKKLMKYIKGPDYADGGILTSGPKEILDLYKHGRGRLTYRCNYNIEDAGKNKKLVITSLAPYFNVKSFFDKCADLRAAGAIEDANDETDSRNGVRLTVEFKNPQPINDIILPMLNTAVTYDFYAIEQQWVNEKGVVHEEGGKKVFKHYTLVGLLNTFIRQRRHIERLLLEAEEKKILGDIELAEARLIATQNVDRIVKIIKDKRNKDRAQIVARLMKEIKYTERQANYVCDLKVIQIANFSADEQKDNIAKLKERLKQVRADLKDLDGVLIRNLKNVMKKFKGWADPNTKQLIMPRRTTVEGGGATKKLNMKVKARYVLVAPDAGYRSFDEAPDKKGDWPKRKAATPEETFLAKGGETATVVMGDGNAQEVPIGYTKDGFLSFDKAEEEHGNVVAGVVTEQAPILMAVSDNAEVCAIEHPQGAGTYRVGKFSTPVRAVLGLDRKDRFLLISKTGAAYWDTGKHLEVRRKNVKGKHLGGLKTLRHAVVVREGQFLYDEHGQVLDPFKKAGAGETFEFKGVRQLFILGKGNNLVIGKDGTPSVLSKQETVAELRAKNVARIWPLD